MDVDTAATAVSAHGWSLVSRGKGKQREVVHIR